MNCERSEPSKKEAFLTPISTSSLVIKDSFSFVQEVLNSNSMVWLALMLPHCSPTFLLMKQLRSSQIKSLPTACFSKALIAHSSSNAAYPHLDIPFVFCSSTRISSFSPFTDKVPMLMRSGVVYLFKCQLCCSASYVGKITRHLHTGVSEHLGISPITGRPSSSLVMSSIFSHLNSTVTLPTLTTSKFSPLAPTLVN